MRKPPQMTCIFVPSGITPWEKSETVRSEGSFSVVSDARSLADEMSSPFWVPSLFSSSDVRAQQQRRGGRERERRGKGKGKAPPPTIVLPFSYRSCLGWGDETKQVLNRSRSPGTNSSVSCFSFSVDALSLHSQLSWWCCVTTSRGRFWHTRLHCIECFNL